MANMSYCRFENTYQDLKDCYDNFESLEDLSESEQRYAKKIYELCKKFADTFEHDFEEEN